jgi:hypothetical protein
VNDERLVALGEVLRSDFENLLGQYTTGWLTNDYLTVEDWKHLANLEAELSCFLQFGYELAALETWLTSGFMPGDLPEFGAVSGEWTDRGGVPVSRWPSQVSSHSPNGLSESNSAISSYFQQKHSSMENVPDYGQPAIPSVLDNRPPKEPSRASTKILDIDQVKAEINPEQMQTPSPNGDASLTAVGQAVAPKGIKELANFLASEEPQKDILNHSLSMPLLDTEEATNKTNLEQGRSLKGLKDLANFLASEQPQKNAFNRNEEQPSHLPYALSFDALINQQEQAIAPQIQTESAPVFPSPNSDYWESQETGVLNREVLQEEAEPSSISKAAFDSGWYDWIPTITAGEASEQSRISAHPSESWQQPLNRGSSIEDYNRPSHQASRRTEQIVRLNQQDVLAAQHLAIQGNSTQDQTTGDGLSPESLLSKDTALQIEMEPTPVMSVTNNPEIDLDLILEAIAQEINREYRRFYGS